MNIEQEEMQLHCPKVSILIADT